MKIESIQTSRAPKPLGNYVHGTVYGELIFLSGIASRDPQTNQVPGLKMEGDTRVGYDIGQETRGTLRNIQAILEEAGSDLNHVLDVQVFLRDMKDFDQYNKVFSEFFYEHMPSRTTIGVDGLPGPISIEMKVIAVRKK